MKSYPIGKHVMAPKKNQPTRKKEGLHPRNLHNQRYDFAALIVSCPGLAPFVAKNKFGDLSVDFSDPAVVKMLNKALLHHFYKVENWDIPPGYLCPPIPGRADYIHHMADLLAASNQGVIPQGKHIRGLDIGMGANCVYPIIGHRTYGWRFVGSDIDALSVKSAKLIVESNRSLSGAIQCRLQKNSDNIFIGMINNHDIFDFTLCNPPFHASLEEATAGSERKVRNLSANARKKGSSRKVDIFSRNHTNKPVLNFGGQKAELWCPGGEAAFIHRMTIESSEKPENCFWYSTLVSKKENLPALYKALKQVNAVDVRTIKMAQGQKLTRIVAWTFLSKEQQIQWREERWG